MGIGGFFRACPVLRQLKDGDQLGLGRAVQSQRRAKLTPRTAEADKAVRSVCPYCAVGCGQRVYAKDGDITQIEGDPDGPTGGALTIGGAAAKRWSIFKAGFQSTRDPKYTVKHQRERLEKRSPEGRRTEIFGGNGRAT